MDPKSLRGFGPVGTNKPVKVEEPELLPMPEPAFNLTWKRGRK